MSKRSEQDLERAQLILDWSNVSANLVAAIAKAYAPDFAGSLVQIDALCSYKHGELGFGDGLTYRLHKFFPKKELYSVHQYLYRGVADENLLKKRIDAEKVVADDFFDWAQYYPEKSIEINVLEDTAEVKRAVATLANCVICAVPANESAKNLAGSETMRMYAYYLLGVQLKMTEWLYAAAALDIAGDAGCSILLMPTRALIQAYGIADRRAFAERGYIRAIINIGAHPALNTDACLVVLTRGNDNIEFIDASKQLAHLGRHTMEQDEMVELFTSPDTLPHQSANLETIESHDWNLEPCLYTGDSLFVVEGTRLGDIAEIRRGGGKRGTLFDWRSPENGLVFYCDASSFAHGEIIDENDIHAQFEYDPAQHAKHVIPSEKDCILIGRIASNIGTPFKVGLKLGARSDENIPYVNKYLLASDSLLLLIPSEEVNPCYLLAFLCSDVGQKLLEQAVSGTVKQLSTRNLREVRVPIPSKQEQKKIEEHYREWLLKERRLVSELEQLEQDRLNPPWLTIHRNEPVIETTFALSKLQNNSD